MASGTYNVKTPAGFCLALINELHKSGRISIADFYTLESTIRPVAYRECEELKLRAEPKYEHPDNASGGTNGRTNPEP